jgi:ABC-type lipoprotein export system ATPase subunit
MALIELRKLEKVYSTGKMEYQALRTVDLDIREG